MVLTLWALSNPVAAQSMCAPRAEIAERLTANHQETPSAAGLASSGAVIEVFASDDGATFTIVMTRPEGISCLVAAGEAWMTLPAKLMVKGPGV
jgi:hypothetical protein